MERSELVMPTRVEKKKNDHRRMRRVCKYFSRSILEQSHARDGANPLGIDGGSNSSGSNCSSVSRQGLPILITMSVPAAILQVLENLGSHAASGATDGAGTRGGSL